MEDKKAQSVDDGGECESKNEDNFFFTPTNVDGSPIFVNDIFQNDQIQPVFLIFNQDLLFAEADDSDASRARAASSATLSSSLRPPLKKPFFIVVVGIRKPMEAVPELRNKSNSTRSLKLWRVRDLKLRSNSDNKDVFVFLNPKSAASPKLSHESAADGKSSTKIQKTAEKVKGKAKKVEMSNSTGSSKLWSVRDLKLRSNNDNNDAFVFLNPKSS
ncbi:hypothetical protein ACFX11_034990 [Malus domestica]